jgi:hypothetical protein
VLNYLKKNKQSQPSPVPAGILVLAGILAEILAEILGEVLLRMSILFLTLSSRRLSTQLKTK